MPFERDQYVHELTVDTVLNILEKGAWKSDNQTMTSAITNDNDLEEPDAQGMAVGENTEGINAFFDIKFDKHVKRILDVGGGRFDCNRNYMRRERNIDLLVWDPYNRSQSHNIQIQAEVEGHKVGAVTSMSVLNVLRLFNRLEHISTLKAALAVGGKAYFKIWSGKQPLQGTYLASVTETSYQANAYADRFLREIEIVFGIGNVKLDCTVPNLIVAVKVSESNTSRHNIALIQMQSKKELALLTRVRERSYSGLYSRNNIYKLFSTNLSILKKMEDDYIERNRHSDAKSQHEYDKKHGLIKI